MLVASAGSAFAQDTSEAGGARIDTTAPPVGAIDTTAMDTTAIDTAAADTSGTLDTTGTSGAQNPPGYRGMERDTTMVPDSGGYRGMERPVGDSATADSTP